MQQLYGAMPFNEIRKGSLFPIKDIIEFLKGKTFYIFNET